MKPEALKLGLHIERATTSLSTPDDATFRKWVVAALAGRRAEAVMGVRIVDDEEGQRFNLQYRGKDYATNVLSFPAEAPIGLPREIAEPQLGDLLICAPVVGREAREQGKNEEDHWAHLTVHGVLHLLGYDHEEQVEADVMEALEVGVLENLGVSDHYCDI